MIKSSVELGWLNSYRIQATASACAFPRSHDDLTQLPVRDWKVIGAGNNIILSRSRYGANQPFLCMRDFNPKIEIAQSVITVGAGAALRAVCLAAARQGLSGLERLWDIPSSIGGAVVMNAGAYGRDIHELIQAVDVFDLAERKRLVIAGGEMGTGYRRSIFQSERFVVLGAVLKLERGRPDEIRAAMTEVSARRRQRFPYQAPNAGSVFKRPGGTPVGQMIEELGLKGTSCGGAQISTIHGGFIVNRGGATGDNVIALASHMKAAILASYSVKVDLEQVIL